MSSAAVVEVVDFWMNGSDLHWLHYFRCCLSFKRSFFISMSIVLIIFSFLCHLASRCLSPPEIDIWHFIRSTSPFSYIFLASFVFARCIVLFAFCPFSFVFIFIFILIPSFVLHFPLSDLFHLFYSFLFYSFPHFLSCEQHSRQKRAFCDVFFPLPKCPHQFGRSRRRHSSRSFASSVVHHSSVFFCLVCLQCSGRKELSHWQCTNCHCVADTLLLLPILSFDCLISFDTHTQTHTFYSLI